MPEISEHFRPIGQRLKDRREDLDLTIDHVVRGTHLRAPWIKWLESGDLQFAETVFIKGYLKQYAEFLRLDAVALLDEYDTIIEKIHFLENERFVEVRRFDADTDVGPMDVIEVFRQQEDETGVTELDAQVRDKILREKRVNAAMMSTAGVLAALTVFYMYLDFGRTSESTPYWKMSESPMSVPRIAPTTSTRARMVLSEPLLTEDERALQDAERRFMDSLKHSDSRFTENLRGTPGAPALSIHESAEYLSQRFAQ